MRRSTHAAAGLALGFGLSRAQHQALLAGSVLALVCEAAALLPDLDLRLHLKHRTVTHSLLALALVSVPAATVDTRLLPFMAAGYGSHLLLDSLTVWGVPLLWPLQKRFRLARWTTGGQIDRLIAVGGLCAALYCMVRWL